MFLHLVEDCMHFMCVSKHICFFEAAAFGDILLLGAV